MYETLVVGGGPAGITSAMYLARAGVKVAIAEGSLYGGQLNNTGEINNYPGFESVQGMELAQEMSKQVTNNPGVEEIPYMVTEIKYDSNLKTHTVSFHGRADVEAKAIILATGVTHKGVPVKGYEEYQGRGVDHCATCSGAFFEGKKIAVIGGGDSAMESSIYMAGIADHVTVIHRRDELRAEYYLQEQASKLENVDFIWNAHIKEFYGDGKKLTKIVYDDHITGETKEEPVDGVFINVGVVPNSNIASLTHLVDKDYCYKHRQQSSLPLMSYHTGVFVAGDVRAGSNRQIVNATGDGALVSESVLKYLRK